MAIAGILAAIAFPSFSSLIASQKANAAASDVTTALGIARSEATKRNANVWLCPKTTGTGGWRDGWQLQVTDCTTLAASPLATRSSFSDTTFSGPASVAYQGSGRVQGGTAPNFKITGTSGKSSADKWVCADLSGRPMISATGCS